MLNCMRFLFSAAALLLAGLAFHLPAAGAQHQDPATAAAAAVELERLPLAFARTAMSTALTRRFGGLYRHRVWGSIKCRRSTETRARCSVNWTVGDSGFSGAGYIWYTVKNNELHWNYSWRIERFSFYCSGVLKKPVSKCIKHYVVK